MQHRSHTNDMSNMFWDDLRCPKQYHNWLFLSCSCISLQSWPLESSNFISAVLWKMNTNSLLWESNVIRRLCATFLMRSDDKICYCKWNDDNDDKIWYMMINEALNSDQMHPFLLSHVPSCIDSAGLAMPLVIKWDWNWGHNSMISKPKAWRADLAKPSYKPANHLESRRLRKNLRPNRFRSDRTVAVTEAAKCSK